jgi:Protein of unknown function (DUF1003)
MLDGVTGAVRAITMLACRTEATPIARPQRTSRGLSAPTPTALLTATSVLIGQRRQAKLLEQRAHLDLQINLLTEQKVTRLIHLLEESRNELSADPVRHDPHTAELKKPTDAAQVLSALKSTGAKNKDPAELRGVPRRIAGGCRAAHSRQVDSYQFSARRFDAAFVECICPRIHALEIERHTQLLRVMRRTGFGTQLQSLCIGGIAAATRVKLALAVSGCCRVLQGSFDATVLLHPADAETDNT